MIINEETKTILLHNPKCGGTFFRDSYTRNHHSHKATDYWKLYDENVNTDMGHINLFNLPRLIPEYEDYKIISFVRNPYNRFVSALKESMIHCTEIKKLVEEFNGNLREISNHISKLNYYKQDYLLRNPCIPWLNPQSYYTFSASIILHFESYQDWNFIFNVFKISDTKVHIHQDYEIDNYTKDIIRNLYYDDTIIFQMYEN